MIEKLRHLIKKTVVFDLIFVFCLSLVVFSWTTKGEIINGNDTTYPLRPVEFFWQRLYQWNHTIGAGIDYSHGSAGIAWHGLQALLTKTGLSIYDNQKFFVFILFNCISFSFYFFVSNLLPKNRLARLVGTVFYCFNPYLFNLWGNIQSANLTAYIFIPLVSGFLLKSFSQPKKILLWSILTGLVSFLTSAFGMNPQVVLVVFLYFVLYAIYSFYNFVVREKSLKIGDFIKILVFFTGFYVFFNIFWLVPELYAILGRTLSLNIPSSGNLRGWLDFLSINTNILNVIRMQGEWTWYTSHRGEPNVPFSIIYQNNPFLVIISFLAFSASALAVVCSKKRWSLFFGLLLVLGLLFSVGANPPWGYLYLFLTQKINFLSFLRSPWYKFSLLTAVSFGVLAAFFSDWIMLKYKRAKFFLAIIVFLQLSYSYPLLTGKLFITDYKLQLPFMFKIPDYVWEADSFLINDKEEYKTVMLPREGVQDFYEWGLGSSNQILNLLANSKPVLTEPTWTIIGDTSINRITEYFYDSLYNSFSDHAVKILSPLNVKYLIQKNDFYYDYDKFVGSPSFLLDRLNKQENLKKVQQFGEWDIYEVDSSARRPFIYSSNRLNILNADAYFLGGLFSLDSNSASIAISASDYQKISEVSKNFSINCYLVSNSLEKFYDYFPQPSYIRFSPKHPLYPFIRRKEERELNQINDNLIRAVRLSLYGGKRLTELERILETKDTNLAGSLFIDYLEGLNKTKEILFSISDIKDISEIEKWQTIHAYLKTQKKQIIKLANLDLFKDDKKITETISSSILVNEAIQKTITRFLESFVSLTDLKKFEIDVIKEGKYDIYLANKGFCSKTKDTYCGELIINKTGSKFTGKNLDNWIVWNNIKLPAGKNFMEVSFSRPDNFSANISIKSGQSVEINDLDPGRKYLMSFNYRLSCPGQAKLKISPPSLVKDINGNKINDIVEDLECSVSEIRSEVLLPPAYNLGPTKVSLVSDGVQSVNENIIEAKDLRIVPFSQAEMFIKYQDGDENKKSLLSLPELAFERIDPTKYRVKVSNAQDNFLLVFSESFHPYWTAKIEENGGKQISINANRHVRINGYANGWLIDKTGDYLIVLEYKTQRMYINLLLLTFLGMLLGLLVVVFKLIKGKRNENKN